MRITTTMAAAVLLLIASISDAETFAVIGDYGFAGPDEQHVADLVHSWNPDFVVTVGDNSYGSAPIDQNIGQYYSRYIGSYAGTYGAGSAVNRFFPCLGNHEYSDGGGIAAYLNYFTLPGAGIQSSRSSGKEHYFDFTVGPVQFFSINSNVQETDGISATARQAQWLRTRLAASLARWKVVFMHHAPYSSCTTHGSQVILQWPYEDWGASVVLAGHDHTYERILRDDNGDNDSLAYFVNGLGGRSRYNFPATGFVPGSAVRYNSDYGAMRVDANDTTMILRFYSVAGGIAGTLIDSFLLRLPPPCCAGTTGDLGGDDQVQLDDLVALVNYLKGGGFAPSCRQEADIDNSGEISLPDLSKLISHFRPGGYSLPTCR